MADNEANEALAPPLQAFAPTLSVEERLQAWQDAYLGKRPPVTAPASQPFIDGLNGLYAPPGMTLTYLGQQLVIDPAEVAADRGFELVVKTDEIWLLNFVAVDFITDSDTNARLFVINFYDRDDGFNMYLAGQNNPGPSTGGTVIFIPGSWGPKVKTQYLTETLPTQYYLRPNWSVNIQMVTAGTDFVSHVRWNVEKWSIVPLSASPPGNGALLPDTNYGLGPFFRLSE